MVYSNYLFDNKNVYTNNVWKSIHEKPVNKGNSYEFNCTRLLKL
jgi:hypothetical protein